MIKNKDGRSIGRYRRFAGWDYSKGASLFITIPLEPRRPLFGRIEGGRVVLSAFGRLVRASLEAIPKLNHGIRLFGYVVMPDHVHFNCDLAPGLAEPLKTLGWAIRRFKNYTTKQYWLGAAELSSAFRAGAAAGESYRAAGAIANRAGAAAVESYRAGGELGAIANRVVGELGADYDGLARSPEGRTKFGRIWQQGYHDYLLVSRDMIAATERYIAYNPLKWELMYGGDKRLYIFNLTASIDSAMTPNGK